MTTRVLTARMACNKCREVATVKAGVRPVGKRMPVLTSVPPGWFLRWGERVEILCPTCRAGTYSPSCEGKSP